MIRAATLAYEDTCRLDMTRRWSEGPLAAWLLFTPSIANAEQDDPTTLRVIHFSRKAGAGAAMLVNVSPLIATDPAELFAAWRLGKLSPGQWAANRDVIAKAGNMASIHFVGFGVNGPRLGFHFWRALDAFENFNPGSRELLCLGTSPAGWPLHPLARGKFAIPNDRVPQRWIRP